MHVLARCPAHPHYRGHSGFCFAEHDNVESARAYPRAPRMSASMVRRAGSPNRDR